MKNLRVLLVPFAIVGATIMLAPDAMARDQIDWSLSIGSPGYYPPPPVVVYRQPPTIYAPPPVVYTPRTVYPMVPPGVVYANPGYVYQYDYYRRPHHGHKHHWERRDRY
ncbi:MAG: hypothetical protein A3K04_09970 [Gallionellales bacterium RBG_16_56_9]|nr:MAG: hypothetical protein A3K04_09970 [Gallionellales bacterium RBG_16_56_9]